MRPVGIRAAHPFIRAYTHVGDLLTVALRLLVRGDSAGPLESADDPAIEIGALARRAARLLGCSDLDIRRPDFEAGSPDIYVGDGGRYTAPQPAAGLTSRTLDEQIPDTAAFLREAP